MRTLQQEHGIIAVLDALGAATYSDAEVQRFMKSREIVLGLLNEKAEVMADRLHVDHVTTFTFNDTILIVLRSASSVTQPNEIQAFFTVVRKFVTDSLAHGILFRGAIAIGRFYADDEHNTVMGQAVTDAAAWYDKTDWIGVVATPRAGMKIESLVEGGNRDWTYLMLDYDVPRKDGRRTRLKAVNWPKVFFVKSISPCDEAERPREKLLNLLTRHAVPLGTEDKFSHTVAFFDHVVEAQRLDLKGSDRSRPGAGPGRTSHQ